MHDMLLDLWKVFAAVVRPFAQPGKRHARAIERVHFLLDVELISTPMTLESLFQ